MLKTMKTKAIIREWMLPIAMTVGAASYLVYHYLLPQAIHTAGPVLESFVSILQPVLIFSMLFLTFCRIEPRELRPHRWHWWLLLIQGGTFVLMGAAASLIRKYMPGNTDWTVLLESAMLCLICPTATAAAVVTRKLGGDVASITTYTIIINLLVSMLVPVVVPFVHPTDGMTFLHAFSLILAKVFPLLILPCFAAWLVRYLLPAIHRKLLTYPDLPFQIWSVSLALAIAVTVKAIVHSSLSLSLLAGIAAISLICCIFQFWAGRKIGQAYGHKPGHSDNSITAGQAIGQKNTVFAIWMGYTFLTPETSIVGGFYSIWHNLYNSWQIHRHESLNCQS